MAGNHEYRHKQYTFCTVVYEVSSFTGNPVDNQRYLPNCYSDIGLGKVPLTKRRLTREFVNERQKTLIFKSLTKGISSFWKKTYLKREQRLFLTVVENLPLTLLIKLRSLTNGNLKKRKIALTKWTFCSYLSNERLHEFFFNGWN